MGNDMRFNVSQLLKEGIGTRRSFPLDETLEALPDTGTTRIQGEVLITCIDKGVWVSGSVETNASSLCGRCLTQVDHKVRFHLDEMGCDFCQANYDDLARLEVIEEDPFLERIQASTVEFLRSAVVSDEEDRKE